MTFLDDTFINGFVISQKKSNIYGTKMTTRFNILLQSFKIYNYGFSKA